MSKYEQFTLPTRYHGALVDWQKKNFPDLEILERYWDKYFPETPAFNLAVKVAPAKSDTIEVGMFKGHPKIQRAGDMKGNMLYSALRIINAQCSTELGSIQQHLCTLDTSPSDIAKFSILRIMAEELRHAYQMFWVLAHDSSWSDAGVRNLADDTMDTLLSMQTGTHILDAFNIPFEDALDSIVFAFLVDRVGKYQLSMQQVFAYSPMSQSMQPMLQEESFHLKAGYELLREHALLAAEDKGEWTLTDIQQRINCWFPRALEMFGNEEGGQTNIDFGFKDTLNGDSSRAYTNEVNRLLQRINLAIGEITHPGMSQEELLEAINEHSGHFLQLPDTQFFRVRGSEASIHIPSDMNGRILPLDQFERHMEQALSPNLRKTDFFKTFSNNLMSKHNPSHQPIC